MGKSLGSVLTLPGTSCGCWKSFATLYVLQGGDWLAAWLLTGLPDPMVKFASSCKKMACGQQLCEGTVKLASKSEEGSDSGRRTRRPPTLTQSGSQRIPCCANAEFLSHLRPPKLRLHLPQQRPRLVLR